MVINKDLLQTRKKVSRTRPKFVRQESWRYDRLAPNWRKPKGKDNKMRLQVSGVPRLVKIGYRGPRSAMKLKVLNPRKAKGEQIKPEVEQTTKLESELNEESS